jgi:glycine/D-amino acid oxidase-like deaminating enzyme
VHIANIPNQNYPDTWYARSRTQQPIRPPLEETHHSRVCVVGGGLAGLSIAHELRRHGVPVSVLEAGRLAWGASGRNGGFVSPGFAADFSQIVATNGVELAVRLYQYSQLGVQRVRENIASFAPNCLMGEGKFSVSRYPAAEEMNAQAMMLSEQLGDNVEYLSTTELKKIIHSDRYFDAIFKHDGFHIHPLNYALALATELESLGGRIFEMSKAEKIEQRSNGGKAIGWKVATGLGTIHCEQVIVCTSGYDAGFYRPVSRSVLPVATHVAVTEPLDDKLCALINTTACISDTGNACDYYRLIDGNRLLWGGKITTMKSPPGSLDEQMHRAMVDVFPELSEVKIENSWSGLMGYCRHKMPVIRKRRSGEWIATAFGGHGLNTTAMAGELVATAIAGDDQRWKDFSRYYLDWNAGWIGRALVQGSYWKMQLKDRIAEYRGQKFRK